MRVMSTGPVCRPRGRRGSSAEAGKLRGSEPGLDANPDAAMLLDKSFPPPPTPHNFIPKANT